MELCLIKILSKEVLAHSDIATTMRYVHSASEQLQSAMNSLNV